MAESSEATQSPAESRGFRWLSGVVIPVLTFALGIAVSIGWTLWSGRLRIVDYQVSAIAGALKAPDVAAKLEIFIDGQRVENISTIAVYLFNRTDADFDEIPVELTFDSPTGELPRMLHAKATAPPSSAELVPTIAHTQPARAPARIEYVLPVLNRGDGQFGFVGRYVFEGSTAPEVRVSVQ